MLCSVKIAQAWQQNDRVSQPLGENQDAANQKADRPRPPGGSEKERRRNDSNRGHEWTRERVDNVQSVVPIKVCADHNFDNIPYFENDQRESNEMRRSAAAGPLLGIRKPGARAKAG